MKIKSKLDITIMITLFLTSITMFATPVKAQTIWTVDDDRVECPDADFTSIQDAVNAASDGDIILVYSGTYSESVSIIGFTSLILKAEGDVIVDPPGESAGFVNGFTVYSDGVTIDGFEIIGANFGIWFEGSYNTFSHNTIHDIHWTSLDTWWDGGIGICLWDYDGGSDHNSIVHNEIYDVDRNGILLDVAWTEGGTGGNIGNSIVHNEVYDFGWYGIEAANAEETSIAHNEVYDDVTFNKATSYGILLITYAYDTVENDIHHNYVHDIDNTGIALIHVGGGGSIKENVIAHNTANDNGKYGILLYDWGGPVYDNLVHHNTATGNVIADYYDVPGTNIDFKNSWN